jgi:hypothetical protein
MHVHYRAHEGDTRIENCIAPRTLSRIHTSRIFSHTHLEHCYRYIHLEYLVTHTPRTLSHMHTSRIFRCN